MDKLFQISLTYIFDYDTYLHESIVYAINEDMAEDKYIRRFIAENPTIDEIREIRVKEILHSE